MTDATNTAVDHQRPAQVTLQAFSTRLAASQLLTAEQVQTFLASLPQQVRPSDGTQLARELVRAGKLTAWQAQQVYKGQTQGLVLGNYVLLDKLGQGGMGAVYKARHKRMDRLVAIKTLSPALTKTPDLVARFQREVQAAARLEHPHIVTAHDADQVGKTCFLVMQYVEGQDLATFVKEHGPLPVDKAVSCILQAARGLEYAHRKGVVHRDIKPANLLLDREGTVKVLDMGLARIESAEQSEHLTSTGAVMGTVDYMAPEQALDTHHADARSDIYSLGCTLHYLLTGRAPFGGDSVMRKLLAHRESPVPDLTTPQGNTSETLNIAFRKMLAKSPAERFQTMTEVVAALDLSVPRSAAAPQVQRAASEDTRFNAFLQKIETEPLHARPKPKSAPPSTQPQADPDATLTVASQFEETDARTHTHGTAAPRVGRRKKKAPPPRRNWWQDWRVLAGAGGVAAVVLTGVIIIKITNKDGTTTTVRVPEGTETDVQAATGSRVTIIETDDSVSTQSTPAATQSGGWPADAPAPAITPFDAAQALAHQESWPPDYAAEREVAEWVLSIGGKVTCIDAEGESLQFGQLPLPDGPLTVDTIDLQQIPSVQDSDLERLPALSGLRRILLGTNPQLTDAGLVRLAEIPSLTTVYVETTGLTDAGLQELAKLPHLSKLSIGDTKVTDSGLRHLAAATQLVELSANLLPISIDGLRALGDLSLSLLFVGKTRLRYSDLPDVVTLFPRLTYIEVRDLQGEIGAGISPLAQLRDLEYLRISAVDVSVDAPHHLRQFPALRRMQLKSCPFAGGLNAQLEQLPRVTWLQLSNPEFQGAGFTELCANTSLRTIELLEWSGGDAELLQLAGMQKLRELSLRDTHVTAGGVQAFHEQRPDVAITGDFNIPAEPKAADYAHEREVAEWVLSIGGTVIISDPEGTSQTLKQGPLPEGDISVLEIDLQSNPRVTDDELERLGSLVHLQRLNLVENQQITDGGLVHLERVKSLRVLIIGNTSVTDQGMKSLAALPGLVWLDVGYTKITDAGLAHLAGLTDLESLGLSGSRDVSDDGINHLDELRKLKSVYLGAGRVTDRGVEAILTRNPDLEKLAVENADREADRTLGPLTRGPQLKSVYVSGDQLSPDGVAVLQDLPLLESVRVGVPVTDEALARLKELPQLKSIWIYYFKRGQSPPHAGYHALAQQPSVESLVISSPLGGGSPNDDELLGLANIATLKRLEVSFRERVGEIEEQRNYTTDWIAKFRELRPDVHLQVDGTAFPPSVATAIPNTSRTIQVGPDAGMVATLKEAFEQANGGDTIEIATDEPLVITEPLSWNKPGPLTIRARDGNRPLLVAGDTAAIEFAAPPGNPGATRAADVVSISGLTIVDVSRSARYPILANRPMHVADTVCVSMNQRSVFSAYPNAQEFTLERCYFWKQHLEGHEGSLLATAARRVTVRDCLMAGGGYHFVQRGATESRNWPEREVQYERTTFLNTRIAWQLFGEMAASLEANRNLYADLHYAVVDFYEPDRTKPVSVRLAQAQRQLPVYRGTQNAYFQCERLCILISPNAENDLAAWQSFTNNGERDPQFIDPQFARPDLVAQVQQKFVPPQAFALKPTSPLRRLKIGCDVSQLPTIPPRLYELLPAEIRPDQAVINQFNVPAEPVPTAAAPSTIQVGPEAGMVATLKEAFEQANGGDTIEIATDEPLVITEPLSWNKPGPLTIRAAEGHRPIVITDQTGQPNVDVIQFAAAPGDEADANTITITGLTFIDRLGATSLIIKAYCPIHMTDVVCVIKKPTCAIYSSASATSVVLERCYFWMQDVSATSRGIVQWKSGQVSVQQCVFAGYGPIHISGSTQEIRCEQCTFLSTNVTWTISGGDVRVKLHLEKNLNYDQTWIGSFAQLGSASAAEYTAALALADEQLVEYHGVSNVYFQCARMINNLTPNAADDLQAWQQLTGNGEVDPRFIDPQFARPDLVSQLEQKFYPPQAFALKPTSPLRRLKIGCDVSQLPTIPPRLYELLPAEMRGDAGP